MRLAIMQPYIFPYIGYYQLAGAVDKFVFLDDVNYINKGWINRNNILINGQANLFTIPLKDASQNKLINEVEVSKGKWSEKLLRTIEMAYKKAPCFSDAFPVINEVLSSEERLIGNLAKKSVQSVSDYLQLPTTYVNSAGEYSNKELKGQSRIIDIVEKENGSDYINPIGGTDLYEKKTFQEKNIRLHFLQTKRIVYPQLKNEFVPFLSIIDVLMFNDKTAIKNYLNEFELI